MAAAIRETTIAVGHSHPPGRMQETNQRPNVATASAAEATHLPRTDGAIHQVGHHYAYIVRTIAELPTTTARIMQDIAPLFVTEDCILLIATPDGTTTITIEVTTPTIPMYQEVGRMPEPVGFLQGAPHREKETVMRIAARPQALTGVHMPHNHIASRTQ